MESRALPPTVPFRLIRLTAALVVVTCAAAVVWSLSVRDPALPDNIQVHTLTFYGVTSGAYILLPFVRRGDIAVVAMWIVLVAGVAPCVAGQEISASHMFADMAGVLMSALPIYIARFRQVAQGDTRPYHRRKIETGL